MNFFLRLLLVLTLCSVPASAQFVTTAGGSGGGGGLTVLSPLVSVPTSISISPTLATSLGKSIDVTTGSSSDVTITLISAATAGSGALQTITKIDSGTKKVIVSNGADLAWLSTIGDTVTLRSNGTTWLGFTWNITPRQDGYTSAASYTWTKPPLAKLLNLIVIQPGSGGGSGARRVSALASSGGSGGGSGGVAYRYHIAASIFGSTEPVVVGAGTAGGAAVTVDSTDGNPSTGNAGGSAFSSGSNSLTGLASGSPVAGGGKLGANSVVGPATPSRVNGQASAANVSGSAGTTAGTLFILSTTAGGGGAGQAVTTPVNLNGGFAGQSTAATPGTQGVSGDTPGQAGIGSAKTNATTGTGMLWEMGNIRLGNGGGGGWSASDGTAGDGAAGSACGGGGGGGGSSTNGNASGAGGIGGDGCVYVVTYFN